MKKKKDFYLKKKIQIFKKKKGKSDSFKGSSAFISTMNEFARQRKIPSIIFVYNIEMHDCSDNWMMVI